jgi:hypothetical protein
MCGTPIVQWRSLARSKQRLGAYRNCVTGNCADCSTRAAGEGSPGAQGDGGLGGAFAGRLFSVMFDEQSRLEAWQLPSII